MWWCGLSLWWDVCRVLCASTGLGSQNTLFMNQRHCNVQQGGSLPPVFA